MVDTSRSLCLSCAYQRLWRNGQPMILLLVVSTHLAFALQGTMVSRITIKRESMPRLMKMSGYGLLSIAHSSAPLRVSLSELSSTAPLAPLHSTPPSGLSPTPIPIKPSQTIANHLFLGIELHVCICRLLTSTSAIIICTAATSRLGWEHARSTRSPFPSPENAEHGVIARLS
jgi:hypothetical protein